MHRLLVVLDFEQKDHCIVYFMDELKYSITEKKNIEDFAKARVMAMVSVREGGKKYAATLVFIGKWSFYFNS